MAIDFDLILKTLKLTANKEDWDTRMEQLLIKLKHITIVVEACEYDDAARAPCDYDN